MMVYLVTSPKTMLRMEGSFQDSAVLFDRLNDHVISGPLLRIMHYLCHISSYAIYHGPSMVHDRLIITPFVTHRCCTFMNCVFSWHPYVVAAMLHVDGSLGQETHVLVKDPQGSIYSAEFELTRTCYGSMSEEESDGHPWWRPWRL